MSRLIAFLRAINIGGGRTVKMEILREIFESTGFSEVRTFIASGNVVFETKMEDNKSLEKKIENRLRDTLGYDVATFIRTGAELIEVANYQPFRPSDVDSNVDFNIIFLADAPDVELEKKLSALSNETDELRVLGREVYWLRRKKPDGTNYSNVQLDKVIGMPFTIRGSKTIQKIVVKYFSSNA